MAWLALSKSGGSNYNPLDAYFFKDSQPTGSFSDTFHKLGHPFGVGLFDGHSNAVNYRTRSYGFGAFTDNWMVDEFLRIWRQGMVAPQTAPTLTAGAGASVQRGRVSFYDEKTGERSPLSGPSAEVTGDSTRSWANLPTEEPGNRVKIAGTTTANATTTITGTGTSFTLLRVGDRIAVSSASTTFAVIRSIASDTSMTVDRNLGDGTTQTMTVVAKGRATHVELWVSVDGAGYRLAVRRQLGATTASESTATLSLGEAAPATFERMPRCSFGAIYHERLVCSGDILNPDTLYVSPIGFPERWEGLTFKTRNGEAITALALGPNDVLLVYTYTNCYALRGWTESDLSLNLLDPEIGAFHSRAVILIHGKPWIANRHGIFTFNGSHHLLLKDRQTEWQKDYKTNRALFESGFFVQDPENYVVQYVVPKSTTNYTSSIDTTHKAIIRGQRSILWTADYLSVVPELAGTLAQPNWSMDRVNLNLKCGAVLTIPGTSQGRLFFGSCDGYVRRYDDTVGTDDSNSMTWMFIAPPGFMGDPLGDGQEGKTFTRLWSHIQSESTAWTVEAYGGDAEAWQNEEPDNVTYWWGATIAASALTSNAGGGFTNYYEPKSIHVHVLERVSGRALTMIYKGVDPIGIRFRGFAGEYGPGPASRLPNKDSAV